jgi:3-hydroxyisobutyrate dehydrogenase-like beta-hydroxyacid dehydrogenase
MHVGFAGVGRMGALMARNLGNAGHTLTLWNRSEEKAQGLARRLGCAVAPSPEDLAEAADVVITMLADDASSVAVHFGSNGLFAAKSATTFIEMGTMSPDHIRRLASEAPSGSTVIDAPVSGATQAADAAQLLIMAGCSKTTAAPLMPVFEAMGKQVICLGTIGSGAVMKLSVNSLIHGINQTLAEAMTLAEASGIAPEVAYDVIEASAACAPMLKYRRALYLNEASQDVSFTVALARKDMEVMTQLAQKLCVATPQGDVTLDTLKSAEAAGFATRDMASILNYLRKENR